MNLLDGISAPSLSAGAATFVTPASMASAQASWIRGEVAAAIQQGMQSLSQMERSCPPDTLREAYLAVALYCREYGLYKESLGLALKGFDSAVLARDSPSMTRALVLISIGFTEIGRADAGHLLLLRAQSRARTSRDVLDILRVHNGLLLSAIAITEARTVEPLTLPQAEILRLAVDSARVVDEMSQLGNLANDFVRATLLTNAGRVMGGDGHFDKGLASLRQAQCIASEGGFRLLHLKALIGELQLLNQQTIAFSLDRLLHTISIAKELKLSRLERSALAEGMLLPALDDSLRRDFERRSHELEAVQGQQAPELLVNPYAAHVDKVLVASDPAALAATHFSI
jgi:hypothetical protein